MISRFVLEEDKKPGDLEDPADVGPHTYQPEFAIRELAMVGTDQRIHSGGIHEGHARKIHHYPLRPLGVDQGGPELLHRSQVHLPAHFENGDIAIDRQADVQFCL
jgi:hypothetical protein